MTISTLLAPDSRSPISMRFQGGVGAPLRARRSVLSELAGQLGPRRAEDAALIVSELVTNSVVHANVGSGKTLTVELMRLDDRVRITVIDPGSQLQPRIRATDHKTPGGFGLIIVDELSSAWGVIRAGGSTSVWCELALDPSAPDPRDRGRHPS